MTHEEAVEIILRRHRVADRRGAQRSCLYPPAEIVEYHGLVGAVEGADAEMDHARRRPAARPLDPGRQAIEGIRG